MSAPHMPFLCIDIRAANLVVSVGGLGSHKATRAIRTATDIQRYALWLYQVGGMRMLDAFEVQLINDACILVIPSDEHGPLDGPFTCDSIEHTEQGVIYVWSKREECEDCDGDGYLDPDDIDDLDPWSSTCPNCGGDGWVTDAEFRTDVDGNLLTADEQPDWSWTRLRVRSRRLAHHL